MGLQVSVHPAGTREFLRTAVVEGGGELVPPDAAEALVWASPAGAHELRALLARHAGIRWVQLPWAGIEPFVDVLDRDHVWTAGQDVYSEPVAELALALALAGLRDFKRRARADAWQPPSGLSLMDGRATIVGAGGIARALAKLLAPFRVQLTVVRRRADRPFDDGTLRPVRTLPFEERVAAFAGADVVFLACALTKETRGLVGARELRAMKPSAWLVNVARGGPVDTDALVRALADGAIGGAGLDVTDPEPLPAGHPLWASARCLITPHCGNTPEMAVPLLSARVRENVRRYAAGEQLLGIVDVDAGY